MLGKKMCIQQQQPGVQKRFSECVGWRVTERQVRGWEKVRPSGESLSADLPGLSFWHYYIPNLTNSGKKNNPTPCTLNPTTCTIVKPKIPRWKVVIFVVLQLQLNKKRAREGGGNPRGGKKGGGGLGRIRPNQTLCADPSSPHIKDSRELSSASSAFHCSRLGIMCFWPGTFRL